MKKITFLFVMLLMAVVGSAGTITDKNSALSSQLSIEELQAFAGTNKHFALMVSSTDGGFFGRWFNFTGSRVETITTDYLFTLENGTIDGYYNIKRVSDQKYQNGGNNWDASSKFNYAFKSWNAVDNKASSEVNNSLDYQFQICGNGVMTQWFNANAVGFNTGQGSYTTYYAFGPLYTITVNYVDASDQPIAGQTPVTYIVTDGTTLDIEAPEIAGYAAQSGNPTSAEVNGEDVVVYLKYDEANTVNITYVVKYNGTTIFTSPTAVQVNVGSTITTLPTEFQNTLFFDYETISETADADKTVEFTATLKESAPFTPSTSFDEAQWYYLNLKNGAGFPTYVEGGNPNVTLPGSNAENDNTTWAFIIDSNTYPKFKVVNKAAGGSVVLGSALNVGSDGRAGGNTYATLNTPGTNACETWTIESSSHYTNGFFIKNTDGHALNHRSNNNLAYWTGTDAGSTFQAVKIPENQITYITALDQLSNDKVYAIYNVRAMWNLTGTSATADASAINDLDEAYTNPGTHQIAIVKKDDKYYLYSVTEQKYLASNNKLYLSPLEAVNITLSTSNAATGNYKWFFSFDGYTNKNINTSGGRILIDGWTTHDEGNVNSIMETAATYSLEEALAAFENYTQCITDYSDFKGITTDFASHIGELGYPKAGTDATTAFTEIMTRNASGENTADDWNTFAEKFNAVKAADNVKMPEVGNFYRIKGIASGRYMQSTVSTVAASGKVGVRLAATATPDVSTIFYLDSDNKLLGYSNGLYVKSTCDINTAEENVAKATGYAIDLYALGEFTFTGTTNGSGILWSWGTEENQCFDRNGSMHDNCRMAIEEVPELPITLNEVNGKFYATFSAPVDIAEISGATLHKISVVESKYVKYEEAGTTGLPANTGVLLISDTSGEATATIGEYTGDAVETNLSAQIASVTGSDGLFFGKGAESGKLGFFALDDGMATKGFKAFVANETAGGAKGLEFIDNEATGIDSMNNSLTIDNGAIYNLQGQKVTKAQKGVFIQNGKKVVVK